MADRRKIGIGIALVSLLAIFFYFSGTFSIIGIDTYISYSNPQTNVINPSEWNTQGMRRSVDLDNRPTFRADNNRYIMAHIGEGGNANPTSVLYTQQDLKGKDFRIFYSGEVPQGWSRAVSLRLGNAGDCVTTIRSAEEGSVEIQSSIINENQFLFKVNGRNICEREVDNETTVQIQFEITSAAQTPNQQGFLMLSSPGYRLPLGCRLGANDVTVFESFDPEAEIDVFALQYPAKRICTVLVQTPTAVGVDRSQEVAQLLARGESINPEELFGDDTIISVLYSVDNVNNILPRNCSPSEVLANGQCSPRNAMVQVCTHGVFNVDRLTCTVQANVLCEGTTIIDGNQTICRFSPPVGQPCVTGSLNTVTGTCDRVLNQTAPVNCAEFGYQQDPQNANLCISYLKDERTSQIPLVLTIIAGIGILVLVIMLFMKLINLLFWLVLLGTLIAGVARFII